MEMYTLSPIFRIFEISGIHTALTRPQICQSQRRLSSLNLILASHKWDNSFPDSCQVFHIFIMFVVVFIPRSRAQKVESFTDGHLAASLPNSAAKNPSKD
jgi:hypothetical protein